MSRSLSFRITIATDTTLFSATVSHRAMRCKAAMIATTRLRDSAGIEMTRRGEAFQHIRNAA